MSHRTLFALSVVSLLALGATTSPARAQARAFLVEGTQLGFDPPPAFDVGRVDGAIVVSVPEHGFAARVVMTRADASTFLAKDLPKLLPGFAPARTDVTSLGPATCTHWHKTGASALHCALPGASALVMWADGLTTLNVGHWSALVATLVVAPEDAPKTGRDAAALPVTRVLAPKGWEVRQYASHGEDIVVGLRPTPQAPRGTDGAPAGKLWASRDGGRTFAVIAERPGQEIVSLTHDGQHFWAVWSKSLDLVTFAAGEPPKVVGKLPQSYAFGVVAASQGLLLASGFSKSVAGLSRDGGRTWSTIPMPDTGTSFSPKVLVRPDAIQVCSDAGLDESRDSGASWKRLLAQPCAIAQRVGKALLVGGRHGAWRIVDDKVETLSSRTFLGWGTFEDGIVAVPGERVALQLTAGRAFILFTPGPSPVISTGSDTATAPGDLPDATFRVPHGFVTLASSGVSRFEVPTLPPAGDRTWRLPGTRYTLSLPADFEPREVAGMLSAQSLVLQFKLAWTVADDTSADFEAGIQKVLAASACGRFDVVEPRRVVPLGDAEVLIRTGTCLTGLGFTKDRQWVVRLPTPEGALYTLVQAPEWMRVDPGDLVLRIARSLATTPEVLPQRLPAPAWQPTPALDGARVLATTPAGLLALTPSGLVRSADGLTFAKVALPGGLSPIALAARDTLHWVQASDQSLHSSADAGLTWTAAGAVFEGGVVVGTHDLGPVAVLTTPQGLSLLYPSRDEHGATAPTRRSGWAALPGALKGARVDLFRGAGQSLFAATDAGAFGSGDGGAIWKDLDPGQSGLGASFDPKLPWMAFSNGVMRSDTAGWRWAFSLAPSAAPIKAVLPDGDGLLLLSAAGGLWMAPTGELDRVVSGVGFDATLTSQRAALVGQELIVVGDRGARRLTLP